MDHSKNYPFFKQNENMTNKHHTKNQPHYSEDADYYCQNQQRFSTNQQNNKCDIYQLDFFEPYKRNEPTRQTSQNPASYNNNFQSQKPINTQSYQPPQMQNEIPLPYYLQKHEITKTHFTNFLKYQMPQNLQMTMNPYLMGGSSISSNKPLMIFTGTDPEYSVEDCLNAVTANLILNIGRAPTNTTT